MFETANHVTITSPKSHELGRGDLEKSIYTQTIRVVKTYLFENPDRLPEELAGKIRASYTVSGVRMVRDRYVEYYRFPATRT